MVSLGTKFSTVMSEFPELVSLRCADCCKLFLECSNKGLNHNDTSEMELSRNLSSWNKLCNYSRAANRGLLSI